MSGPLLETGSGGIERWWFGSATRRKEAKPPLDKVVRRLLRLDLTLLRSCALSALGVRFGVLVVDTLGENLKGVRITDLVAKMVLMRSVMFLVTRPAAQGLNLPSRMPMPPTFQR